MTANPTTKRTGLLIACFGLAMLAPEASFAQRVSPDSVICNVAADSLRSGLVNGPYELRALGVSSECRNAAAIIAAFDRHRGLPYSPELAWFVTAIPVGTSDPTVHDVLLTAATDAGTSVPVRVLSLLAFVMPYAGAHAEYDQVVGVPLGAVCRTSPTKAWKPAPGSPFALLVANALHTADAIVNDVGAPTPVRSAANCLGNAIRLQAGWGLRTIAPLNPQGITLAYACGNDFVLRNTNDQSLTVRLEVVGTARSDTLEVRPAKPGLGYSEQRLGLDSASAMRLFLDDVLLQTAQHGNTTCTH